MNRILEIVLNKRMAIIRVGVSALALVVLTTQVLLATQPASALEAVAGTASGEAFSAHYYDARGEYNKVKAATASDLEVKRASECEAVVWMASADTFSGRYPDAKTEYCKALAGRLLLRPISPSTPGQ